MPSQLPVHAPTFEARAAKYGCQEIIRLDGKLSSPDQLDYLDLLPSRSNQKPILSAVVENQGTALLYLVDGCGDTQIDADSLKEIRRQLANRSDPAWLGILKTGSLEIYPIGFGKTATSASIKTIHEKSEAAPLFFQSVVHGTFEGKHLRGTDYIFQKIFDLLTQTTDEFVPQNGHGSIDALQILSMAGRALFFRFLIDRGIVCESECPEICPSASLLKDAFSTAESAAETSTWLDETFNGDFLPLIDESVVSVNRSARETAYLCFYKQVQNLVGPRIFLHLQAILRGWRANGGNAQMELDWGDLDFAHIPVGVLSQVYESFSHRADPKTARDTSVHYTPRTIAGLMVDESFAAMKDPASATVLDPTCGAGIFLVLAFRRLVRERWQRDEARPKTAVIQEILYKQIRGFDISESALRLAALSLYITAIEVNGTQRPPRSLKFPRNLRGEVLHKFGSDDNPQKTTSFSLGSLGPEVSSSFDKFFDIVIGNPPWTRLREAEAKTSLSVKTSKKPETDLLNLQFTEVGRRVLNARGYPDLAKDYENPDKNPDIPFLWRATEWAKDCGVIALAMPARLFGRTSGNGYKAWCAIMKSIAITGLINGADLRWSSVWKDVKMPFCIFFGRNEKPSASHRFQYSTPLNDPVINGKGRFRIDYESAQPLSVDRVIKQPWLLKTLSLGTWLDVDIMEALINPSLCTLGDYWKAWDPHGVRTGQGYNRSPKLPQNEDDFLGAYFDFIPKPDQFAIPWDDLNKYQENHGTNLAAWPRKKALYKSPLVIVPQSPGDNTHGPRAYLADKSLAFSQSFYGYSCAEHPESATLAALIYLLPHSILFAYFCLMTSRRSGFDRQTFNKEEFDALPFPEIEKLSDQVKTEIRDLAYRLDHDTPKPWDGLNALIFKLYGLDEYSVQIASDTLFSAASYRKAGREALDRTTDTTRAPFVNTLKEELEPYFDVCGAHAVVREVKLQSELWKEPWFFLTISHAGDDVPLNNTLMRKAMEVANQHGTSRIIIHATKSGLVLGLLNQRRWWTVTRARLCAQHIIRHHMNSFGLTSHA